MRRREVIALAIPLALWPATAFAQVVRRQWRVGFLGTWGEGDLDGTARQDRFRQRLKELGWSDDQIYTLDGSWEAFTPAERAMFLAAKKLAASPIVLTDADVAQALKLTSPRDVVQLIRYVTTRAASYSGLTMLRQRSSTMPTSTPLPVALAIRAWNC